MEKYTLKYFSLIFQMVIILLSLPGHISAQTEEDIVTRMMAELTVNTKSSEISDYAYKKAKMSLIDIMGTSMAGYESSGITEIKNQILDWGGKPEATVWFTDTKVPSPMAGFVNSAISHAMDLDDWHQASQTHISSVTVPTALTVGEMMGSTGREVLDALVIGVEVAGRVGRPFNKYKKHGNFLPTSVIGGFGATAIACRLMGLSVEQTVNAFGIYYSQTSGNRQALFDRTLTKRIQPGWAVKAGILAAVFAKQGITGPAQIILSDAGLLRIYGYTDGPLPKVPEFEKQLDGWEIEMLCFKKYACCGASHTVVEGAIEIAKENDLKLADVESVELFGVSDPFTGIPWKESGNPHVLAQFCAPYEVASAIKNRKLGPEEITNQRIAEDQDVSQLAKKIQLKEPAEWGPGYPGKGYKTIRIKTKDGRTFFKSYLQSDLFNPDELSMDDIIRKMKSNAAYSGLCSPEKANTLVSTVKDFESIGNVRDFVVKYLAGK
ncbi:MAG: MmgE/PrpD family protein [Mangrovibacterium sp.]